MKREREAARETEGGNRKKEKECVCVSTPIAYTYI